MDDISVPVPSVCSDFLGHYILLEKENILLVAHEICLIPSTDSKFWNYNPHFAVGISKYKI